MSSIINLLLRKPWLLIVVVIGIGLATPAKVSGRPQAPTTTFEVDLYDVDLPDINPGDGKCLVRDGGCTLRAAVEEANALSGSQLIIFSDEKIIVLLNSPLPTIDDNTGGVTINGVRVHLLKWYTDASPPIVIDSDGNRIHGLIFKNYSIGVQINAGSERNVIGTNGDGLDDLNEGNEFYDSSVYEKQLVLEYAVHIMGNENIVAGNLIGISSTEPLRNTKGKVHGVYVGGNNNRIGTDGNGVADVYERNIISGNSASGVVLAGESNWLAGNYIGLNAAGDTAVPNGGEFGYGVNVTGNYNVIGTNEDGVGDFREGNVISGNSGIGVYIFRSEQNVVAGNMIGTNPTGTAGIGNSGLGVGISEASKNRVGTDADGLSDTYEKNIISGNGGESLLQFPGGLHIFGATSFGNVIAGNYIGTDENGNNEIPNKGFGIRIYNGCYDNRIGTNGDGTRDSIEKNLISGNDAEGVLIERSSTSNTVAGNWIGINAGGTIAVPNRDGVVIRSAGQNNLIGASPQPTPTMLKGGNVISGNTNFGVLIMDDGDKGEQRSKFNSVRGNVIGAAPSKAFPIPNGSDGVVIVNSDANKVTYNTITGNENGIRVQENGGTFSGNSIDHNTIYDNTKIGIFISGEYARVSIYGDEIYNNGELGIDIAPLGPNGNDPQDPDVGPNLKLNYPEIAGAMLLGDYLNIRGVMNLSPGYTEYYVMFYGSPACDPTGYGEGKHLLSNMAISEIPNTPLPFELKFAMVNLSGDLDVDDIRYITAVTVDTISGSSEFSPCVEVRHPVFLPSVLR